MTNYEILQPVHLGSDELGRQRKEALETLAAEAGYYWGDKPSIGRWLVALADERIAIMKGKDWVYCSECGESYNRLGPGHKCDPKALAAIAREEEADQEVREREKDEKKG